MYVARTNRILFRIMDYVAINSVYAAIGNSGVANYVYEFGYVQTSSSKHHRNDQKQAELFISSCSTFSQSYETL